MSTRGNNTLSFEEKDFRYDQNHPDILAAKKIEPYHNLFDIFNIQDTEMISLIMASAITIMKKLGVFSKEDIYFVLDYMSEANRKKVVEYLIKRNWIVFNGIDFEMPDRVKSLIKFLFTSFLRGDISVSDSISLVLAEYEMAEHYNLDEIDKDTASHIALIGELHNIQSKMGRVLQRRNHKEIMHIIRQSSQIINNIQSLKKLIKKRDNSLLSKFSMRQEAHNSISEVMITISRIMQIGAVEIIGNTKSAMADYISPEMINDFLETAPVDLMVELIRNNFASPKIINHLTEEKIIERTKAFVESRPEQEIVTPSPLIVEYTEEETVVQAIIDPLKVFYEELVNSMGESDKAPFEKVVFKPSDSFGIAIYRTGQMLRLASEETKSIDVSQRFIVNISENIKDLVYEAVEKMSEAFVERRIIDGESN